MEGGHGIQRQVSKHKHQKQLRCASADNNITSTTGVMMVISWGVGSAIFTGVKRTRTGIMSRGEHWQLSTTFIESTIKFQGSVSRREPLGGDKNRAQCKGHRSKVKGIDYVKENRFPSTRPIHIAPPAPLLIIITFVLWELFWHSFN